MNHQEHINEMSTLQAIKRYIVKHNLKEYKCDECGISDEWNNKKLALHLHHRNGIHTDNQLDNLQFVCPNCHSQTDSYCGAGKIKPFPSDNEIIDAVKRSYTVCGVLRLLNRKVSDANAYKKIRTTMNKYNVGLFVKPIKIQPPKTPKKSLLKIVPINNKPKTPYPDTETMRKLVWERAPYQLANEFGVRDTSIRYWCRRRGIKLPPVGYWRKKVTGNL